MPTRPKKDAVLSLRVASTVKEQLQVLRAVAAPGGISQSSMVSRLIIAEAKRHETKRKNYRDNKNEEITDKPTLR